uniref:Uncharacterized protein n=1 Tax=Anguilla anguilla TaxID=7936 RepID=A0A0E9WBF3_ANGAN
MNQWVVMCCLSTYTQFIHFTPHCHLAAEHRTVSWMGI